MSEQNIAIPGTRGEGLSFPSPGGETPAAETVAAPARPVASALRALEILKWVFSFPAMLGTFLVGATFYAGRVFTVDPDMWWHITTGQTILATHHWPTVDPYSFTVHGQPWIAYEWLGDVLIGAVARIGGVRGLDALLIVLGSAVMLALYVFATIRAKNSKAGFLAAAVVFTLATGQFTNAPADAGLSVPRADADCAGALPPRKAVADLVSAAGGSGLGEHTRLVHYRAGSDPGLLSERTEGVSSGRY